MRAALVLAMVWWAWSAYAWMTNAIDVENAVDAADPVHGDGRRASSWRSPFRTRIRTRRPGSRSRTSSCASSTSALYAGACGTIRATSRAVTGSPRGSSPRRSIALIGGFVDPDYRAVDLARLARDRRRRDALRRAAGEWHISASHFAERFALIVIIALGESIVAIGIGTSELARDSTYALVGRRRLRRRRGTVVGVLRLHCDRRRACAAPGVARGSRPARARRLHVLPLPGRARDHLLRRRGEEDARAPARPALRGRPLGARAGRGDLPARVRADALPRHPARSRGSVSQRPRSRSVSPSGSTGRTRS